MIFELYDPTAIEVIQTYLHCIRGKGQKVGLTSGSFDLVHFHHVLYLTRCRRSCDVLIVGVDSDELVRERKDEGRPITYDARRAVTVDALKQVTFTCVMNSVEDFGLAAKLFIPDFIFKNDAFRGRETEILGREYAGAIKIVLDVVDHMSTTQILEAARIAQKGKF